MKNLTNVEFILILISNWSFLKIKYNKIFIKLFTKNCESEHLYSDYKSNLIYNFILKNQI